MQANDEVGLSVPGVEAIDHTADLGLEIRADTFADLLRRAAAGMTWLILETRPTTAGRARHLRLEAGAPASLLRDWLRELLYWHEAEGFSPAEIEFTALAVPGEEKGAEAVEEKGFLDAVVRGGADPAPPVRELKGVTLHGLMAERRGDDWYARVIFDV